jgi:RNA polymerase sigma factor (TIGR02999 family)
MGTSDRDGPENGVAAGDRRAIDALVEAAYAELHAIAERALAGDPARASLTPTTLIHEAYLRLAGGTGIDWQGETHFRAVASIAMRRAIVDHARSRRRQKRGGRWRAVALDDAFSLQGRQPIDALVLHDALERMRELDERQARVVEMRVFGGLSLEETASALGVSPRTVDRDWRIGRAWLRRALAGDGSS